MDVKDVKTECIPETMLLCGERIIHIIQKYIRFCLRELAVINIFPISLIYGIIDKLLSFAGSTAFAARYALRTSVIDPIGIVEKWLFPKIGAMVRLFSGVGVHYG